MTFDAADTTDRAYLAQALQLAERGLYTTDPNPRVGCVLVKDGSIVGTGWHQRAGGPHAEVEALRAARDAARGATAYVTLEPCCHHGKTPPCSDALIAAGIARVVAAMHDPNPLVAGQGGAALAAAGIETHIGVLAVEAEQLNRGFVRRMRTGRPYVVAKLAMSLDGRTALANGASRWITSAAARQDAHLLRARSSAIVTGVATLIADDPRLTARLPGDQPVVQPLRVVLDSTLRAPTTAAMLNEPGSSLIFTTASVNARRYAELSAAGYLVETLPADARGRVDLSAVLDALGHHQVNEVLIEAGPTLNGAWLQTGLVDEWVVYMAPCVLGNAARGLFEVPELITMDQRFPLPIRDIGMVGSDLKLLCSTRDAAPVDASTGRDPPR